MTTARAGLPHLLELIRSPRGGIAILGALLLSVALVIQAGAATLMVTTSSLPDGAQSTAYSQTLVATGGTAPYTWAVIEGSLPTGLSLTGVGNATISGSPSVLANSAFTVRVTDGDGNIATKSLAIKVNPQLTVATTALASGVIGVAYTSQTLTATGGATPYTWAVTTGALPLGLTLSGGVISGTPTATAGAFTVTVTDAGGLTATKSLTINVSASGVLTVVTSALPNGIQNLAGYTATLTAAGGTSPYVNWTVSTGSLPAGLTLAPATGIISGTPTGTGTTNFSVTVTDSAASPATSAQKALSITVNPVLVITSTDPLTGATAGTAYANVLTATGGATPHNWTVSAGTLPAGLTLFNAAGIISGVPTTAGANPFTVQVTDANGVTTTKALSIAVAGSIAPTISTTALPNAIIGSSYTYQLQRTGGIAPFAWSVTPALPAGLALDASTGLITGTPTGPAAAATSFTFQVSSPDGADAGTDPDVGTKALSIAVVQPGTLNITTTSLPNATVNVAYSQQLTRTGGTGPFVWSTTVAPPAWLTLNASTGLLTGTPTAVASAASFTVRVTDSASAIDDQVLSITVGATAPSAGGTGNYYGPCKAFYSGSERGQEQKSHATAFRRLIDAAGVTAQVRAFCDANGQKESDEDQEFRRLCSSFFSGSNGWRSGGSKVSGMRRLIEAAGTADAVRAFCTTNFGAFTGQEDDDDELHGTSKNIGSSNSKAGGNNNGKKGKN